MSRKRTRKALDRTLVDVIIPVHERFDLLELCIDAIPDALEDNAYRVILVDNASKNADSFYDQFVSDPGIIVSRNKENEGFPRACNKGFRRGRSPLVFFLNSDVVLKPGSVAHMIKQIDDPIIGVVGMKLLFPTHHEIEVAKVDPTRRPAEKVQHVGVVITVRGEPYHVFIGWDANHKRVNRVRDIFAVTGAAFMTRRSLYQRLGGFDEIYGGGSWEDIDFCVKVRELGYNVIVDVDAVGTHYTNATASTLGIGFPIKQNQQIFMSRWANKIEDWSWRIL